MMAEVGTRPLTRFARFGRLWSLPPSGYGNGPDDDAWAPVLDTSERIVVPHMLSAFRAAQVPAYVTPLRTRRERREMTIGGRRITDCGPRPAGCLGQRAAIRAVSGR